MTQYPNEKDPHPNWLYPGQQDAYPPPNHYTSRDGVPAPSASQYQMPPPPQGYDPSQDPPPDYGYAQSHPDGRSAYGGPLPALPPPSRPGPYDTPNAGPSSSSSTQNGGQGGLGSLFGGGNKGPPPMWQRQPPAQLPYNSFPPMCMFSKDHDLSKGFPEVPPPCQMNPHPFVTHDVTEEDWKRFLADMKKTGSLSGGQHLKSNVIPLVTGMSLVSGFLVTRAIERKMKTKNRAATGDLVDQWNHYFFGPRRMEVVLSQASERLSGKLRTAHAGDDDDDDDDDGDSSEDESAQIRPTDKKADKKADKHAARDARRAARQERRDEKRQKRAERRARKDRGEDKEPYQLTVSCI